MDGLLPTTARSSLDSGATFPKTMASILARFCDLKLEEAVAPIVPAGIDRKTVRAEK